MLPQLPRPDKPLASQGHSRRTGPYLSCCRMPRNARRFVARSPLLSRQYIRCRSRPHARLLRPAYYALRRAKSRGWRRDGWQIEGRWAWRVTGKKSRSKSYCGFESARELRFRTKRFNAQSRSWVVPSGLSPRPHPSPWSPRETTIRGW